MGAGGRVGVNHAALIKAVLDYLRVNRAYTLKVAGGPYQRPGVPDVLACIAGRLIAIEVKTGRGALTTAQEHERDWLIASGAVYVECRQIEMLEDALVPLGLVRFRLRERMPLGFAPPPVPAVVRRHSRRVLEERR